LPMESHHHFFRFVQTREREYERVPARELTVRYAAAH